MEHQLMAKAAAELSRLLCSQLSGFVVNLIGNQSALFQTSPAYESSPTLSQVSNSNKPIRSRGNLRKATHEELGQYLMKVVANHAERVARWGLSPEAEVKYDMLNGMRQMWLFVSQHSN
jgi:hypothetical protein